MLRVRPLAYTVVMPGKNIVRYFEGDQYYHVYSRGVAKQPVFLDDEDYRTFLHLFKRYLSEKPAYSSARVEYPWYAPRLELLAYCLMPNHVHLLLYQFDEKAITEFMRSLMTSYSMYFNRKYKRVGPVFQSRYRASHITQDNYLEHISRYIHLNPLKWEHYPYSSLKYYVNNSAPEWISPRKIVNLFPDASQYFEFVKDYESHKQMLDEIAWELADS